MFIIKIIFISILIKFLIAREKERPSNVAEPSSSTTENTLPGQQQEDIVIEVFDMRGPPGGRAGRNVGGTNTHTGQEGLQQQQQGRQEGDHLNTTVTIQHIRARRDPCCVIL
uniref:Uncharacterized protein n=1 Tax=Meloidogyne enterolobii TaxID=390850 RepID=A0A6V7WWK9_MELEN|nr:unnamed protein product [Meloidogyne enterolobii]